MKISNHIRGIYFGSKQLYEQLQVHVDKIITTKKQRNWHYESRVKSLESFALKAETGRFLKMSSLEDFFGGCLVVENSSTLAAAERMLTNVFELVERRPRQRSFTHKDPASFVFDDVRLFLKVKTDDMLPERAIDGVLFEVQLKTFLQHAWSIATHDLVYKGNEYSWSKNRIAFQVKAMLEHAELSISTASSMAENIDIDSNKYYRQVNAVIKRLTRHWEREQLPSDLVRLSQNVLSLIQVAGLNIGDFNKICDESKYIGRSPSINMSPYTAIAMSVLEMRPEALEKLADSKYGVYLPPEYAEGFRTGDFPEDIVLEIS